MPVRLRFALSLLLLLSLGSFLGAARPFSTEAHERTSAPAGSTHPHWVYAEVAITWYGGSRSVHTFASPSTFLEAREPADFIRKLGGSPASIRGNLIPLIATTLDEQGWELMGCRYEPTPAVEEFKERTICDFRFSKP